MLFNSLAFAVFLPVTVIAFGASPVQWRWAVLLLASVIFCAASGLDNLLFLGSITLLAIGFGWALGRTDRPVSRRLLLAAGLVMVLGALVLFKFYDFLAGEIERLATDDLSLPRVGVTAPAGFSFYVFMAASYLIDVYRRQIPAELRGPGLVALYVTFFPKLLAGPIERATAFLPQIAAGLRMDPANFVLGLQLIGWGLFKKVVVADNLAPIVDGAFRIAAYASPTELLIAVYFFAFQIYCDFSGYADIAIGVALLFGIRLMDNFRRPYLSVSPAEFWSSRWHISLARWFRDYLYIPLGGSRAGWVRHYFNVMVVFLVSGLWHAGLGYGVSWNFLIWGALNGFYVWVATASRPLWTRVDLAFPRIAGTVPWRAIRILLTFHLILVTWVFFRADSLGQAATVFTRIWEGLPEIPGLIGRYPFTFEHYLGFALIALIVLVEILGERRPILERLPAVPLAVRWTAYYALIFALLLLGNWGGAEFIYMQF